VGVDYSLFYLRREREERARGHDARSSLEIAAATSGRAVLVSGLTVLVAMAGMFISGDKAFISFAYGRRDRCSAAAPPRRPRPRPRRPRSRSVSLEGAAHLRTPPPSARARKSSFENALPLLPA
jgi:hypothetical protein